MCLRVGPTPLPGLHAHLELSLYKIVWASPNLIFLLTLYSLPVAELRSFPSISLLSTCSGTPLFPF